MVYVSKSLSDINWVIEYMDELKKSCMGFLEVKMQEVFKDIEEKFRSSVRVVI